MATKTKILTSKILAGSLSVFLISSSSSFAIEMRALDPDKGRGSNLDRILKKSPAVGGVLLPGDMGAPKGKDKAVRPTKVPGEFVIAAPGGGARDADKKDDAPKNKAKPLTTGDAIMGIIGGGAAIGSGAAKFIKPKPAAKPAPPPVKPSSILHNTKLSDVAALSKNGFATDLIQMGRSSGLMNRPSTMGLGKVPKDLKGLASIFRTNPSRVRKDSSGNVTQILFYKTKAHKKANQPSLIINMNPKNGTGSLTYSSVGRPGNRSVANLYLHTGRRSIKRRVSLVTQKGAKPGQGKPQQFTMFFSKDGASKGIATSAVTDMNFVKRNRKSLNTLSPGTWGRQNSKRSASGFTGSNKMYTGMVQINVGKNAQNGLPELGYTKVGGVAGAAPRVAAGPAAAPGIGGRPAAPAPGRPLTPPAGGPKPKDKAKVPGADRPILREVVRADKKAGGGMIAAPLPEKPVTIAATKAGGSPTVTLTKNVSKPTTVKLGIKVNGADVKLDQNFTTKLSPSPKGATFKIPANFIAKNAKHFSDPSKNIQISIRATDGSAFEGETKEIKQLFNFTPQASDAKAGSSFIIISNGNQAGVGVASTQGKDVVSVSVPKGIIPENAGPKADTTFSYTAVDSNKPTTKGNPRTIDATNAKITFDTWSRPASEVKSAKLEMIDAGKTTTIQISQFTLTPVVENKASASTPKAMASNISTKPDAAVLTKNQTLMVSVPATKTGGEPKWISAFVGSLPSSVLKGQVTQNQSVVGQDSQGQKYAISFNPKVSQTQWPMNRTVPMTYKKGNQKNATGSGAMSAVMTQAKGRNTLALDIPKADMRSLNGQSVVGTAKMYQLVFHLKDGNSVSAPLKSISGRQSTISPNTWSTLKADVTNITSKIPYGDVSRVTVQIGNGVVGTYFNHAAFDPSNVLVKNLSNSRPDQLVGIQ